MAISSIGIGSGLEVEDIITKLVELEKSPLTTLQTKQETIETKISTYGEIKSLTSTLADAVAKLTRDSGWNGVNISSSNTTISGTMTGIATPASYSIKVKELATAQTSLVTKGGASFAKDEALGGGGLVLTVGGKATKITVGTTDTLTKVAESINNSGAGVRASVIKDTDGKERLMVTSTATGSAGAFSIAVSAGSSDLLLQNFGATADGAIQKAKNAEIELNGVTVTSTSNTFADLVPGLSISVSEVTTTASLLTVSADTESMKKNIQDFVDAYNAVNDLLSASTKYDETSTSAGILQGDSSTVSLQNALRMLTMGTSGSTGAYTRLAQIGIEIQQGGALKITSESKLTDALKDPTSLKALFANKADSLGNGGGIAVNFKKFTDGLLAFDGTLNSKTDSLEDTLDRNQDDQDKVNARATTLEARLRAQYSALDVKMASLSSLSTYIEQQVAAWNKSTS